jgi:hypothetical protein
VCHLSCAATVHRARLEPAHTREIGIDAFQADRAPDHRYRTSALAGRLFNRKTTEGRGYFQDGRFKSLMAVINHSNDFMHLGLSQTSLGPIWPTMPP